MIKNLVELLREVEVENPSEVIAIAKGRDFLPKTWRQIKDKIQTLKPSKK